MLKAPCAPTLRPSDPHQSALIRHQTATGGVTLSVEAQAATLSPFMRRFATFAVMIALFMNVLDATVVNIGIPTIARQTGATTTTLEWLVAGYSFPFSVLLIPGGRLGDWFGYRRVFLLGVGGFTLASVMCGLAGSAGALVAARVLQGGCAAVMMPQVLALVQVMYSHERRLRVLAMFGVLGGTAATLGAVIGGLIISANLFGLGWRPIFLLNLPIGVVALVMGAILLPRGRSAGTPGLDWVGLLLMSLALSLVLLPLMQGRSAGWPIWCVASIAAGLLLLAGFARFEIHAGRQGRAVLVVPALFGIRSFVAGLVTSATFSMAFTGYLFVWTLLLQEGFGLNTVDAAIASTPFAAGAALSAIVLSRRLMPRLGGYMVCLGSITMCGGLWLTVAAVAAFPHHIILCTGLPQLLAGMGMGCVSAPTTNLVLRHVSLSFAGSASGLMTATQQFSGATGVALAGAVFFPAVAGSSAAVNFLSGFTAAVAVQSLLLAITCAGGFILARMNAAAV
jgi:EmrB/QacA subfamily drug resistance transporter